MKTEVQSQIAHQQLSTQSRLIPGAHLGGVQQHTACSRIHGGASMPLGPKPCSPPCPGAGGRGLPTPTPDGSQGGSFPLPARSERQGFFYWKIRTKLETAVAPGRSRNSGEQRAADLLFTERHLSCPLLYHAHK